MTGIWERFGFEDSPYKTEPLEPSLDDYRLFTGRTAQSSKFLTQIDRKHGAVVVISGDAGIGKTSFFNIQQYLVVTERAGIGTILIPCYVRTPILQSDDERSLARRLMHNALESVSIECAKRKSSLPKKIKEIKNWMSHQSDESGFSIEIAGFGASISTSIPSPDDASLENWRDIFGIVSLECVKKLNVQGLFLCIDNAEEIGLDRLSRLLMAYRDTLFTLKNIWWVVIGQSHLYNLLTAHDVRIAERINGPGVEITPMSHGELHNLVEKRIKRYRQDNEALSPLSEAIHQYLFEASRGVARFALNAADMLINELVSEIREVVLKDVDDLAAPEEIDKTIYEALQRILFNRRVPDNICRKKLQILSAQMIADIGLSEHDVDALEKIGKTEITVDNYSELGFESSERFKVSFLDRLTANNLLQCRSIHGESLYRLRNYAYLCADLNAFSELRNVLRLRERQ